MGENKELKGSHIHAHVFLGSIVIGVCVIAWLIGGICYGSGRGTESRGPEYPTPILER